MVRDLKRKNERSETVRMKKLFDLLDKLPLKASTREFIREGKKVPGYTFLDFLHGYVYGRWPYFYIGIGTGNHPLSKILQPLSVFLLRILGIDTQDGNGGGQKEPGGQTSFADSYHGKVMPLQAAKGLVRVGQDISLNDLERVIPYAFARDLILRQPDHLVALECPCRAVRPNPCLPLDVCLIMGEPFASFIAEHHPRRSRRVSPEEAASILEAEHRRGHVHHAFFKDAMLGRFYAICNCCSCCCGAMNAHRTGTPMLASSGYRCRVQAGLCIGCGACVDACPFHAITIRGETAEVDSKLCMGCGVCIERCEREAISLERDSSLPVPLELEELIGKR
jgi:ferredoxin